MHTLLLWPDELLIDKPSLGFAQFYSFILDKQPYVNKRRTKDQSRSHF